MSAYYYEEPTVITHETSLVGGTTRYLGPTETKGSRIKVTIHGMSKTFPMSYSAHNAHVEAFLRMVEWWGYTVISSDPDMIGNYDDAREVQFIADSESGRGCIYSVNVTMPSPFRTPKA
jgi:hypothetical protein